MTKKEETLIGQYAKSLVEVAFEHNVSQPLKTDLLAILETFEATQLEQKLASLAVSQGEKENLIRLLKDPSTVYINNLIELLIQNDRMNYFAKIVQNSLERLSQINNEYDVQVSTTVPLTEKQKFQIRNIVLKKFGFKTGRIIETIDKALLGGFIINVNNNVIDTSLKRQLSEFKKKLI